MQLQQANDKLIIYAYKHSCGKCARYPLQEVLIIRAQTRVTLPG